MKKILATLLVLVAVSAAQAAAPAPKAPAPRANPVAASSAAPAPNAAAAAPNAGGAAAAGKPAAAPAEDAIGRSTPRGAVQGFLKAVAAKDFRRAALYLDLSDLPENERRGGRIYAQRLSVVLDRAAAIDPEQISDAPEGKIKDGLPPDFERVASIAARDGAHEILLQRATEQDIRVWKFSAATVDEIQDLFDSYGHGPLVELLPAFMLSTASSASNCGSGSASPSGSRWPPGSRCSSSCSRGDCCCGSRTARPRRRTTSSCTRRCRRSASARR